MTILAGTPTTTPPAITIETETPPRICRCGNPTRISYIAAGDCVVPGLWQCTHCAEGRRVWPPEADYRCD